MKRLKKRAVILLAAAAMFTVSPAFAANQNGKGHSEDGRGVSGSTGNQGNGKGAGNAGGQKGNNNGGNGGSNGGNGNSNGGGKGNGMIVAGSILVGIPMALWDWGTDLIWVALVLLAMGILMEWATRTVKL